MTEFKHIGDKAIKSLMYDKATNSYIYVYHFRLFPEDSRYYNHQSYSRIDDSPLEFAYTDNDMMDHVNITDIDPYYDDFIDLPIIIEI